MNNAEMVEFQWPYIQRLIASPESLERSAAATGALIRRRGVADAGVLLRLAFLYAFCGFSLRQTAALAAAGELAQISDVALLKRFRKSAPWLGYLLAELLAKRAVVALPEFEYCLRLIDATTVNGPASKGTDWRVHLALDLSRKSITDVELTDATGGESLSRFQFRKNDIVIADAGYASRLGFDAVVEAEAYFLVRINWSNTPLEDLNGNAVDLLQLLRSVPEAEPAEFLLQYRFKDRPTAVRLVAVRKSEPAAETARQKALRTSRKRGSVDPRTLEAAAYTFILTNLPVELLDAGKVLELYRFRWQIELAFKRLKSIIRLADLPVKDPDLARMYLTTRLLGAVVIDDLTARYLSFSPWGYSLDGPSFIVAGSQAAT
jgi:hypothetical protein